MKTIEKETNHIINKHAPLQLCICAAGLAALVSFTAYSAITQNNTAANTAVETDETTNASDFNYVASLGQYTGLTTSAALKTASQEDIDTEITNIVKQMQYTQEVTGRAVQAGDLVNIEYTQTNAADAGVMSAQIEQGAGSYPTELEEALLDKNIGDNFEIDLDDGTGAGTTNHFNITIAQILEYKAADDDFAASLGLENITTLAELNDYVAEQLNAEYQQEYNEAARQDFIKQLRTSTEFNEIPEGTLNTQVSDLRAQLEEMAQEYSTEDEEVTVNDIIMPTMQQDGYVGTVDDYLVYYVTLQLQNKAALKAVFEAEDLEYSQAELYSSIATDWVAEQEEHPTLLSFVAAHGTASYEEALINAKAMDFIAEHSNSEYKVN
ncbi:hypothetical protein [Butyrivibrio sp.]|uniref:hypothetical protein n=1 Tax=Butyrivibrio sp. TaxID=28121 RepID=UPI0025BC289C|nr:hypothetical protein [Butyrivibrio sp.]MBQ9304121.1 hypothetical protein [Butyrivibrio sp.]